MSTQAGIGPARWAIQTLIANVAIDAWFIDRICHKLDPVTVEDLCYAVYDGMRFILHHPLLDAGLYEPTTVDRMGRWYVWREGPILSEDLPHPYLLGIFRDLATMIVTIQLAVQRQGNQEHIDTLLFGRRVQNQFTEYQRYWIQFQHWDR